MHNMTDYNISDFQMDCYAFNQIANKHNLTTLKDITQQYKLILEEVTELKDKGIDSNDPLEVLDAVLDTMVTALGLLQKLEYLGVDVNKAMRDTAENNLTKYPSKELTAIQTAQKYEEDGIPVQVEFNSDYELFVIKNWNDKVMKPIDFESNDLSNCIPTELLEKGFQDE
jgi:hypothetical protein